MSEWDQRMLCPDGGCVGVIGADGTCKACGRVAPNWGDERQRGLANEGDEDEDDLEEEDDEDVDEGDEDEREGEARAPSRGGEVWTERSLCPNGACIGVIGDDGTCKVCGRAAEDEDEDEGDDEGDLDEDSDENDDDEARGESDDDGSNDE
ncbi:MAG: hypothetical protein ACTHU0_23805, partial [Kofleriaceae bacterium]